MPNTTSKTIKSHTHQAINLNPSIHCTCLEITTFTYSTSTREKPLQSTHFRTISIKTQHLCNLFKTITSHSKTILQSSPTTSHSKTFTILQHISNHSRTSKPTDTTHSNTLQDHILHSSQDHTNRHHHYHYQHHTSRHMDTFHNGYTMYLSYCHTTQYEE